MVKDCLSVVMTRLGSGLTGGRVESFGPQLSGRRPSGQLC